MKKIRKNKLDKNKKSEIVLDLKLFYKKKLKDARLKKAAEIVMKEIETHFTNKGEGWPITYNHYVDEVFYVAYGEHLESYILNAMYKSKLNLQLQTDNKFGGLCIAKADKPKNRTKKRRKK